MQTTPNITPTFSVVISNGRRKCFLNGRNADHTSFAHGENQERIYK